MKTTMCVMCSMIVLAVIVWATDYKEPYELWDSGGEWKPSFTRSMITNQSTWLYRNGKYVTSVPADTEGVLKFKLARWNDSPSTGFTEYERFPRASGSWISTRTGDSDYQTTKADIQWLIDEEG